MVSLLLPCQADEIIISLSYRNIIKFFHSSHDVVILASDLTQW